MSRRVLRRKGGQRFSGRGGNPNARYKLLNFSTGTFTRGSDGYYYPTPSTQAKVTSNVLRTQDDPADTGSAPLFERAHTNLLDHSEQFDNAAWTKVGCTVTANAVASPFSDTTADQLDFTGGLATDGLSQTLLGAVVDDSSQVHLSVWARCASGTHTFRLSYVQKDGVTISTSANLTATTTWQRFSFNAGVGVGVLQPVALIRSASPQDAGPIYIWGAQATNPSSGPQAYLESYVQTAGGSATCGTDTLTFPTDAALMAKFNAPWSFRVAPYWANAQVATRIPFSFGTSANEVIFLSSTGAKIRVVESSVVRVETAALTFSANQVLTITINPVAGTVTVVGASSGNGVYTGTPWAWPGTPTLRVGGRQTGGNEFGGRVWEPYNA